MIIVTGGAGFIGSNIVAALNRRGQTDIVIVDQLEDGHKMVNLVDLDIADYVESDQLMEKLNAGAFGPVEAIIHQGACSATTEWNGRYVMEVNYDYSKQLLHWCQDNGAAFIYASSASVYGMGENGFREDRACEKPINMYAYSKFLFDQYVRRMLPKKTAQVVGLRYFNVYGPRETHKGAMASTAFHFSNQVRDTSVARLFEGTDGYANGGQERDFVFVRDCVSVNLWMLDNPDVSGIYNCGSGRTHSFNNMAEAVIDWHGKGEIEYVPFPDHLRGAYQSYTCADLTKLREAGYKAEFTNLKDGVRAYLDTNAG
ncbi:ADP-glyceromanno-heptose 6-epimerase (plasmid) [Sulfitobacter sp. S223]|uniref:ADP-glyceromanno-heptose 6-epimerase n=1 Tax=Sulfitobacter sp. S223 TaxID=2867023 RepID=UPI0021A4D4B7|nr:ADP-glyceromanno-heptose 6-epimerase [Sulfitobacter sp. S223]UWR28372.1 ADP-glyceromanno-heptose 6-epimerase [Sulfitobacter sp. S223]